MIARLDKKKTHIIQECILNGDFVSVKADFHDSIVLYTNLKANNLNCHAYYDDDNEITVFCVMEDKKFVALSNYFNAFKLNKSVNVDAEYIDDFVEFAKALGYDLTADSPIEQPITANIVAFPMCILIIP